MLTNFNIYLKDGDVGLKMYSVRCHPHEYPSVSPQDIPDDQGICETSTGIIPVFRDHGYLTQTSSEQDGYGGIYLTRISLDAVNDSDDLDNNTISKNSTMITEIKGNHTIDYNEGDGMRYNGVFEITFWNTKDGYKKKTYSISIDTGSTYTYAFTRNYSSKAKVKVIPGLQGMSAVRARNTAELPILIHGERCLYLRPTVLNNSLNLVVCPGIGGDGETPSEVSANESSPDRSYVPVSLVTSITSNPISDGIANAVLESKDFANSIVGNITKNFIAR